MIIKIRIDGDNLTVNDPDAIVSGSKNYYEFQAAFTSDWAGLSKFVVFPAEECSLAMTDGDTAVVPEALIAESGILSFGLIGLDSDGSLRIATNYVRLRILEGAREIHSLPPSPDDSATWETYIGKIGQKWLDMINDAGSGFVKGPDSSTSGRVAVFDGETGKLVKDGGVLISDLAKLLSPEFYGVPKAPTAPSGTNTAQIASTAFVQGAVDAKFPIQTGDIAKDAVTQDKLAEKSVGHDQLQLGSVTGGNIQDGTITGGKIAERTVGLANLAPGSEANRVLVTVYEDNKYQTHWRQIDSSMIMDKQVQNSDIADETVVGSEKLKAKSVTGGRIADKTVGTDQLADKCISADKLQAGSVTQPKIKDGAVTEGKLSGDVAAKLHSHDNKAALDTITQAKISSWDGRMSYAGMGSPTELSLLQVMLVAWPPKKGWFYAVSTDGQLAYMENRQAHAGDLIICKKNVPAEIDTGALTNTPELFDQYFDVVPSGSGSAASGVNAISHIDTVQPEGSVNGGLQNEPAAVPRQFPEPPFSLDDYRESGTYRKSFTDSFSDTSQSVTGVPKSLEQPVRCLKLDVARIDNDCVIQELTAFRQVSDVCVPRKFIRVWCRDGSDAAGCKWSAWREFTTECSE